MNNGRVGNEDPDCVDVALSLLDVAELTPTQLRKLVIFCYAIIDADESENLTKPNH